MRFASPAEHPSYAKRLSMENLPAVRGKGRLLAVSAQGGALLSDLGASGGLELGLGVGIDQQGDEECAYFFFSLFSFRFSLSVNFATFCFSFLFLSFFPFSAISPLLIHDFIGLFPFGHG